MKKQMISTWIYRNRKAIVIALLVILALMALTLSTGVVSAGPATSDAYCITC